MSNTEQIASGEQDEFLDRGAIPTHNVIPVMEEQLHISKQVIETGKVHVSKKIIEEAYSTVIPVFEEEIVIERKKIGEYIEGEMPGIRLVDGTTIISVVKEVIVKRLLLVEELHITRLTTQQSVPVTETLRREEVTVSRTRTTKEPEDDQINT